MRYLLRSILMWISALSITAHASVRTIWLDTCHKLLGSKPSWSQLVPLPESQNVKWVEKAADLDLAQKGFEDAFDKDLGFIWLAKDSVLRRRLIRSLLNHSFINGGVLTDKEGRGTALWLEQPRVSTTPFTMTLSGQLQLIPRFGIKHTSEMLVYDNYLEREHTLNLKAHGTSVKTLRLYVVGVDPRHQKQGVGTSLILPVVRYADLTGRYVILDTAEAENVAYYQRFNFKFMNEGKPAPGYPQTYFMLRSPQPVSNR